VLMTPVVKRIAGSREIFIAIGIITPRDVDTRDVMAICAPCDYYVYIECTNVRDSAS